MQKTISLKIDVDDDDNGGCGIDCPMMANLNPEDSRDACPMSIYYDGFWRGELCLKGEDDRACEETQ